jgi:hypothetical protein
VYAASVFRLEDASSNLKTEAARFLKNRTYLPTYTTSHPRRSFLQSSSVAHNPFLLQYYPVMSIKELYAYAKVAAAGFPETSVTTAGLYCAIPQKTTV